MSNALAAFKNAISNIYKHFYYSSLISAISVTFMRVIQTNTQNPEIDVQNPKKKRHTSKIENPKARNRKIISKRKYKTPNREHKTESAPDSETETQTDVK